MTKHYAIISEHCLLKIKIKHISKQNLNIMNDLIRNYHKTRSDVLRQ